MQGGDARHLVPSSLPWRPVASELLFGSWRSYLGALLCQLSALCAQCVEMSVVHALKSKLKVIENLGSGAGIEVQ